MGKATKNYGFILEDDPSTKFKEWRESINGTTNSNFIALDGILAGKSDKSARVECTLVRGAWEGQGHPYVQELTVAGLKAAQDGVISIARSATSEQCEAADIANLRVSGQEDGRLTISADGERPIVDIPVIITLQG